MVPTSPSVVYVIENRQRIGEDIELCDEGVLVWVVDGSRRNVDRDAGSSPQDGPGTTSAARCSTPATT